MINKKTVLVLGAGASNPYGFPLGRDLVFNLCRRLGTGTADRSLLCSHYARSGLEIDEFIHHLQYSNMSVDAFLENHPEYLQIGKAGIATALIPCEEPSHLVRSEAEFKWYEYLFQRMGTTPDAFSRNANCLGIITFNYDRSLEYFFYYSLTSAFGGKQALELLAHMTFVHVYGQLGKPVFGQTEDNDSRDYGASPSQNAVVKCVSNI